MTAREVYQAALELLGAGAVYEAVYVLRDALDALGDDPAAAVVRCPGCRRGFRWAGELEAHRHRCVALWDQEAA